jgi:hypothetical protein
MRKGPASPKPALGTVAKEREENVERASNAGISPLRYR